MESTSVEALLIDGEWESLCGMFNFENELEHAMDTLGPSSFYNDHHHHHRHDQSHVFCSDSNVLVRDDHHHFDGSDKDVNVSLMEEGNNVGMVMSALNYDPNKENQLKRKLDIVDVYTRSTNSIGSSDVTGKKLRVPRQGNGSCKRMGRSKKNQKVSPADQNNVEDNNTWTDGDHDQNLMNSFSSDDENASQETNTVADLKGRTRASKGTATDPQSLYARKRRERINERLKILQNLVPNGTKVDISTMLEEAVHYVKFLQLQIKLLSSDDLWMYAPLAYNGVDMGLHQRLFSRLL